MELLQGFKGVCGWCYALDCAVPVERVLLGRCWLWGQGLCGTTPPGQGHSQGLGRGSWPWGLLVLVLKGRLCCICASLGQRRWVVCGPLQESGAAKVQHSSSDALSCSASSLYSKPLFIYIWNIFTFCSEKKILGLLHFALANTILVVLKYYFSLLNDKSIPRF